MHDGNNSARGLARGCLWSMGIAVLGMLIAALLLFGSHGRARATEMPVMWIADLNAPAVEVPAEFAASAGPVFWCESKFNPAAVGSAGERGIPQIHPVHFPAMRKLGLSPESSSDLVQYAVRMWERSGWGPWSCRP